ncbi:hypothetical protein HY479_03315 [Candidatus Uhrbacteria bacterium]|nr:hypothetical protein [Candidatus Uhrbacteria bacterium]
MQFQFEVKASFPNNGDLQAGQISITAPGAVRPDTFDFRMTPNPANEEGFSISFMYGGRPFYEGNGTPQRERLAVLEEEEQFLVSLLFYAMNHATETMFNSLKHFLAMRRNMAWASRIAKSPHPENQRIADKVADSCQTPPVYTGNLSFIFVFSDAEASCYRRALAHLR